MNKCARYTIRTDVAHLDAADTQDREDAIHALHRWVLRNADNLDREYVLFDREKNRKIHATTLATNPEYHHDPYGEPGNYVQNNADGTFTAYRDGYCQSWSPTHRPSYEEAAKDLFLPWAGGGYKALYYVETVSGDPVLGPLCSECALASWLEDGSMIGKENDDTEQRYCEDITCSACSEIISPHICCDCGWEIEEVRFPDTPTLEPFFDENNRALHYDCLLSALESCKARKTGLRSYTFTSDPWWGNTTFVQRGKRAAQDDQVSGSEAHNSRGDHSQSLATAGR